MAISAKDVKKLREERGAGMKECKKALGESDGDFQGAIDLLRKKGQKISAKRADKSASEGSIFATAVDGGKSGYMIAMNCETDFVAKNEEYVALGNSILGAAASNSVSTKEELDAISLPDGRSVAEHLTDLMGKMGERIEISAFEKKDADQVVSYIHSNGKLGVLVALGGANSGEVEAIGKDVAMQIAAMNPVAVDASGVAEDVKEKEYQIGKDQAIAEGKPEKIVGKIAEGRLNKYIKENTLLTQSFVKDSSKSVDQVLKEVDKALTVVSFQRVVVG